MKMIISGGQTGADRTALEIARALGVLTGGWCPLGWRTDEGSDPTLADFGLQETRDRGYRNRTRYNVRDSDGTVLFGDLTSPGCRLTIRTCVDFEKPYLVNPEASDLVAWLTAQGIGILNVAGNRRRTNPGIVDHVRRVLKPALELYLELEGVR